MKLALALTLAALLCAVAAAAPRRVCYFTNWSQYRGGFGRFTVEHIDASLCSHLVFAFAKLQGNDIVAVEWNDEGDRWTKGSYDKFNDLKKTHPGLKTSLSVGGWNMGVESMTAMLATEQSRAEFAQNTIRFVRKWRFDGLDLVFQYPGHRGSPAEDKQRFTLLLKELNRAFAEEATNSGRDALLLSAAVSASVTTVVDAYETEEIGKYLDFANLMAYDFNNGWDGMTGHNAPLHGDETDYSEWANVVAAATWWIDEGFPADKLVLGMALYGRGYTLRSQDEADYGAWTTGPSAAGQYTKEKGFMAYYEVCEKLDRADAKKGWNDVREVPHVVYGDQWIGYDDEESLELKVEYLVDAGLGGWMVWTLDSDDFRGSFCQAGRYPLLTALNHFLLGPSQQDLLV